MSRIKAFALSLALTAAFYPVEAHAFVFSAIGLIGGALAGAGILTPLVFVGPIGVVNAGVAVGAFLSSGLGSLLLTAGASALKAFLGKRSGGQNQAPTLEAAKVNVRITEPERWLHAGIARSGGGAVFGEFDNEGAFWAIFVHGDSELTGTVQLYLDDRPVELDGSNNVITDEFCLNSDNNQYDGTGTKVPIFKVWTTTYTASDPTPPAVSAFKAKFPEWTDEHVLAGTCFSVLRGEPLEAEHRYKAYRWRGTFNLGEPSVSIAGKWSRCYDPREESHDIDDPTTWEFSRNPVLIWAWFRTHPYGRNKAMTSINWDKVAEQADICDQEVTGEEGTVARYQCGTSIPESKERHIAEAEILLSCDGMIMHDTEGKAYPHVGHYTAPSVTLIRSRDIMAMASRESVNGESETDGVIVRYIEPELNYAPQPAAAWVNPIYYEEGTTPRYLTIDILTCQNHNQAMRLAKAFGLRSQSAHRLAPTVGLRGLQMQRERFVDLQYDETFTGDYEIATPVEVDQSGVAVQFGCVPVDENRWTLLEGEEQSRPVVPDPIASSGAPVLPTGVTVSSVAISGSGGNAVRLEAAFDASPRPDHRYEFYYQLNGETTWRPMVVRMDDQLSYSDTVPNGLTHKVRWRTVTSSGKATDYVDPVVSVLAIADTSAPDDVSGLSATGGVGVIDFEWTNPNSSNFFAARIYLHTADAFGASTLIAVVYGSPNAVDTYQATGLSAGTYYGWVEAINGSGVPSDEVATGSITVT